MGSDESKPTRTLTIINEDADGTIRVTESAERKLTSSISKSRMDEKRSMPRDEGYSDGHHSFDHAYSAPMESLTLRKRHAEEIHALREVYKERMKMYEDENKYLWLSTTKKLADDLTNIEEKYTHKLKYDTVCPDVEAQVESCYSSNRKQPLKCSKIVKDFVGCVRDARFKALASV